MHWRPESRFVHPKPVSRAAILAWSACFGFSHSHTLAVATNRLHDDKTDEERHGISPPLSESTIPHPKRLHLVSGGSTGPRLSPLFQPGQVVP